MSLTLQAGNRQLDLSQPVCMGIINVTPDSFSDGGQLGQGSAGDFQVDLDRTLRLAETMVADGAAILDVGGESTRPGAQQVSEQQELQRVLPVIEALAARVDVILSVDTSTPTVMRAAIAAGAHMVNDVRALGLPGAIEELVQNPVAICLMHMRGSPATMQDNTHYEDVLNEVLDFLQQRVRACRDNGIAMERLLVDPGFGFGKSAEQNFLLLRELSRLQAIGVPIVAGVSRKSMIGAATGRSVEQRLAGSIAAATLALQGGANIIRSHDVAATVDAIRVHCAYIQA